MEEWKKIKSGRSDEEQSGNGKGDSAEMIYQAQNFDQRWKSLDEKDFKPLNAVVALIEKEQKRIKEQREKSFNKNDKYG